MSNNWIAKVMGQPITESRRPMRATPVRSVIGEAEELDDKPESEPTAGAPERAEAPSTAAPEAPDTGEDLAPGQPDAEAAEAEGLGFGGEDAANGEVGSQVVQHLVSSWQGGSKMDVASQLLYTSVSYTDFVKLVLQLGPESVELGALLDELSEVQPSIDQEGGDNPEGAERVLSRIAQRRKSMPEIEAPGETAPEQDAMP